MTPTGWEPVGWLRCCLQLLLTMKKLLVASKIPKNGGLRKGRMKGWCGARGPPGGSPKPTLQPARSLSLCSGFQLQLLQAGCGVQGPVGPRQAPAEPTHRREPDLARRARAERGRGPDGEAAAAARHGGPAGTDTHRPIQTSLGPQEQFSLHPRH